MDWRARLLGISLAGGSIVSAEERVTLQSVARRALGTLEQAQALPALQRLERGERFEKAWAALGILPAERRADAFYKAVEGAVVPMLNRIGLDGALAWRDRYREA
jgi:hypothetical protein